MALFTHPIPPQLSIIGLTMTFGGSRTLDHLDLRLNHGEIVGMSIAFLERTELLEQAGAFSRN
ncbi:MAG: hypothetical protein RBT36_04465 [Desulfobulbus sp.]|jgi:hypothetical protein|nr:hypothetical protein [Desulfobulbus sp.]